MSREEKHTPAALTKLSETRLRRGWPRSNKQLLSIPLISSNSDLVSILTFSILKPINYNSLISSSYINKMLKSNTLLPANFSTIIREEEEEEIEEE